jgi:pyruvate,water dikinase
MHQPERALSAALHDADEGYQRLRAGITAPAAWPERLAAMERELAQVVGWIFLPLMPTVFPSLASIAVIDRLLVLWLGARRGAALELLRGLPGNVTTEMDLKLWAGAQRIRADEAARRFMLEQPVEALAEAYQQRSLPPVAQSALDDFMAEYGARAIAEIDLARPRWHEDPTPILQNLHAYLQLEDPHLAPDAVFQRGAAESERLAADYAARLRPRFLGGLRAALLTAAVRRLRLLGGVRETPKFYLVKILDACRGLLLDLARSLVQQGALERVDDIFFIPWITLKEFVAGQSRGLKDSVAARRADYERELARRQMPRLLLSTGEAFYAGLSAADAGPNDLVGEPVSPGIIEGPVRVVLDPRGVRLVPGEILVCPATDPGWTPLFLTAGGLVMEIGGMVTHGSVVAREYGIPAVVGVHEATTRLRDGQRVRVDGNSGRVMLLDK